MDEQNRRTVVITGAAGGVGQQLIRAFIASGHRVFGVDYSASVQDIASEHGATGIHADIRSEASVKTAFDQIGAVDALVNNAGVIDRLGNATELALEDYDRIMEVNARGALLCSRAVLPGMIASGQGSIVNVASVAGLRGGRAGAAYTMSKWALVGLTMNLAATLGPQGIRANAVAPGSIATSIGPTSIHNEVFPSAQAMLTRDSGKPPAADPSEIAAIVHFLASDAASRVNGAIIPADAGWIAY
jgi:NAD(P)-dependent dehydrogenase (short-subunit alcohol dehydrogenase family)